MLFTLRASTALLVPRLKLSSCVSVHSGSVSELKLIASVSSDLHGTAHKMICEVLQYLMELDMGKSIGVTKAFLMREACAGHQHFLSPLLLHFRRDYKSFKPY